MGDGPSKERTDRPSTAVLVEIVHTVDCAAWREARSAVRRIAAEEAIPAVVGERLVATEAEARELRFPGSPTILMDGRDVERASGSRRSRLGRTAGDVSGSGARAAGSAGAAAGSVGDGAAAGAAGAAVDVAYGLG